MTRRRGYSNGFIGNWIKGLVLHETLFHPAYDPLKRNIFGRTVYWHAREVNEKWNSAEDKGTEILRKYGLDIEVAGNMLRTLVAFIERIPLSLESLGTFVWLRAILGRSHDFYLLLEG